MRAGGTWPGIAALAGACGSNGLGSEPEFGPGWSRGPALPELVQEIHAAVLGGRIYTAGGFHRGSSVSTTVYRLDSTSARWERAGDLPEGRHHMPLAVAHDSLYAIGGLGPGGFGAVGTLWLYDERNDRWMERAPLPETWGASAVGVVGGKIFRGRRIRARREAARLIAIYDPATDRWRHGASIPTPRDHLAAAVVGGKVYAAGGRPVDPDKNFSALEIYDPDVSTDAWTSARPLPTPRHGLAAAVLGNRIYVIGGGPKAGLAQTEVVEVYAP
jgi:N-acetylneuraminic acid mutarotase